MSLITMSHYGEFANIMQGYQPTYHRMRLEMAGCCLPSLMGIGIFGQSSWYVQGIYLTETLLTFHSSPHSAVHGSSRP